MDGGLRERKRRATERAIETTAVDIAHAEGVRAVTVDRICAIVGISRSTFFNYYPTLEQAIFGRPLEFDPERSRRILERHGDNLPLAATALVIGEVRGGDGGDEMLDRRVELFSREPDVTGNISWGSPTSRKRLVKLLTDWLDENPQRSKLGPDAHAREARLAVGISIVLGDEVMREWRGSSADFALNVHSYERVSADMAAILA